MVGGAAQRKCQRVRLARSQARSGIGLPAGRARASGRPGRAPGQGPGGAEHSGRVRSRRGRLHGRPPGRPWSDDRRAGDDGGHRAVR
eukprot:2467714-Alexandrium_andersonii.AAC.1